MGAQPSDISNFLYDLALTTIENDNLVANVTNDDTLVSDASSTLEYKTLGFYYL